MTHLTRAGVEENTSDELESLIRDKLYDHRIGMVELVEKYGVAKTTNQTLQAEMMAAMKQLADRGAADILALITSQQSIKVAGKEVKFSHTAVNLDMHMSIDGYHNPKVCPECIQPGLLVGSKS